MRYAVKLRWHMCIILQPYWCVSCTAWTYDVCCHSSAAVCRFSWQRLCVSGSLHMLYWCWVNPWNAFAEWRVNMIVWSGLSAVIIDPFLNVINNVWLEAERGENVLYFFVFTSTWSPSCSLNPCCICALPCGRGSTLKFKSGVRGVWLICWRFPKGPTCWILQVVIQSTLPFVDIIVFDLWVSG